MSPIAVRRKAFIMAAMMLAVCAAFAVPAFTGLAASGDETETVVIVSDPDPSAETAEVVEEYAKIYSEVKHQEAMGRDVKVVAPDEPRDKPADPLIDGMKDMVGKDRFVPGDREMPEAEPKDVPDAPREGDAPSEAREEPPEKRDEPSCTVISLSEAEPAPDPEFIQKVADLIEEIGAPDSAGDAKALRDYAAWLLLQDLNDILSTASVGTADRKDGIGDVQSPDDAAMGEPVMVEADPEDPGTGDISDPSPYQAADLRQPCEAFFSYYTGVTTCGQILL